MATVTHTSCPGCGITTPHLLVEGTEVCTRCLGRVREGAGVTREVRFLRVLAGGCLAAAAGVALGHAATTPGEQGAVFWFVFVLAGFANWTFWTLAWPRRAASQMTSRPLPSCPYCPAHRQGDRWYRQPAALIGRDGRWAWCGRCGAIYLGSRGKWQCPDPAAWETTFRQEAPP